MSLVFIAAILVGIVAFKQDWETQAREAEGFMGGEFTVLVSYVLVNRVLTMSRKSRMRIGNSPRRFSVNPSARGKEGVTCL